MNIKFASFKKLMAALVVIGLTVVGTYSVWSIIHPHSPAMADAHKAGLVGVALAAAPPQQASKEANTSTVPDRVYWGAAHNHTGYSFDAGMFGVTLGPDDLFKFATGGEVKVDNGMMAKIDRPLDWLAITDHAEYLGIADQIRAGNPDLLANPQGKRWYEMSKQGPQEGVKAAIEAVASLNSGKPVFDAGKLTSGAWAHAIAAAEKWNQPGVFTTLHGFEWTSAPGGNNLHRTVIFRDNADRVSQVVPFSTFDSPGSGGTLEVHGRVRQENGWPSARHPAQR